jgi:hypothetical protein
METSNERKSKLFSLIRLPFAHHGNGSLTFVRLLTKKQTEVILLQTDLTDLPIYEYTKGLQSLATRGMVGQIIIRRRKANSLTFSVVSSIFNLYKQNTMLRGKCKGNA